MSAKVVTLGELLMRLSTPGRERFSQAQSLDMSFGGAEANVAVSLALLGCDSVFLTGLPNTPIGERALQSLRQHGVEVGHVVKRPGRIGCYFMESGANQRSGQVIYDRADSVFANLESTAFPPADITEGDWFHISGITPAVSESAAKLALNSLQTAKAADLRISLDINYRSRLWDYGKTPADVLPPMVELADILIAGRGDCQQALDIHGAGDPDGHGYFETLTANVMTRFPNLTKVAVTIRDSRSAEHHNWAACMRTSEGMRFSRQYEIRDIVDRVGSGDAFAAGLIYGLVTDMSDADALEFAAAANCLKHSIVGDFNLVSRSEIEDLVRGGGQGRVRR